MLPSISGEMRLGTDPELRYAPSGVAVAKVRAVASSRKKDASGEWQDDKTVWVSLIGFGKLAENMAESLKKRDLVVMSGRLQVDEWTDKDNATRTSVEVVLDTIGPSLAFAAAQSVETQASARPSTPKANPSDDPWNASAQPASVSAGHTDEPPF